MINELRVWDPAHRCATDGMGRGTDAARATTGSTPPLADTSVLSLAPVALSDTVRWCRPQMRQHACPDAACLPV